MPGQKASTGSPDRRDLVSQPLLWHCAELRYVGTGYIVSVGKTK